MIPIPRFAHVCFGSLLCVAPILASAQVKFFGVGDLPGGIVQSEVRDTARVGDVLYAVGNSSAVGAPADTAFLWTSTGGLVPLPPLAPGVTATNAAIASAITPDAAFIASRARFNPAAPGQRHAVRVTTSGLTNLDLGTLPGFPQFSAANAISNDGSVLYGFARYEPGGKNQAVRYTAAGPTITAIPFLNVGDTTSVPVGRGTSADGTVMVGTSTNDAVLVNQYGFGNRAFRYVHGTGVSAIPLLAGGTWNIALALSPNGNLTMVGGDSTAAPNGEAYLHNATTASVTPLGTPGAGWNLSNLGGMTSDGSIVVLTFGAPGEAAAMGFVRNASGWHTVDRIVAGAGIDLTGWRLHDIVGISTDGTRIWGNGNHNGNTEGWIAEFPAGYLAAYGSSLPAQSIVGSWSNSDNTSEGASVVAFLNNGTYFHIVDAPVAEAPDAVDGYERGTYTWNPATRAFTITPLIDTNGTEGASGISGLPGMTVNVSNDVFTLISPFGNGAYSAPLVAGSSPIVGGWLLGNSTIADSSTFVVFFPNGTYLLADDNGAGDPSGHRGMERGTYTWDQGTGAFTASAVVDTDGNWGLSHLQGPVNVTIVGDTLTLTESVGAPKVHARVVAAPLAPSVVVAESRRTHGAAGAFDVVLGGPTTNPTTEPRQGPAQNIVFIFDKPVTGGNAAVTEGAATVGTPTFSGSQMTVPLSAVANQQYVTVTVSNVTSADGGTGGAGSVRVGLLSGDVSQNRVVTVSDLAQVNAQIAQVVSTTNFLKDVNASGTLTVADKGLTNQQVTKALPTP